MKIYRVDSATPFLNSKGYHNTHRLKRSLRQRGSYYINYKFEVARFELHNGNDLETLSLFQWLLRDCAGKWAPFVG